MSIFAPRPVSRSVAIRQAVARDGSAVQSGWMTVTPGRSRGAADDGLVDALLAMSRVLVGIAARSLAALDEDVTLPQYRTLVLLVSHGPQRVVDLAQELGVTSSTATRMCDRLIRKGLAGRHERSRDRRASWVGLTPAGRDLVGEVMRLRRAAIAELVDDALPPGGRDVASALHALVEAAGEVSAADWPGRLADSPDDHQNYVH